MKCKLFINCQYYQNYSDTDTPYWKPKGGHEFVIEVESDVMYSNKLEEHLTKMVEDETTEYEKFEYRGHELKFSEPTELNPNKLMKLITNEDE